MPSVRPSIAGGFIKTLEIDDLLSVSCFSPTDAWLLSGAQNVIALEKGVNSMEDLISVLFCSDAVLLHSTRPLLATVLCNDNWGYICELVWSDNAFM